MPVAPATVKQQPTAPAALVEQWIAFIRAMEDQHQVTVRQSDAEVRAVAELVADFGVRPPVGLPPPQEPAPAHQRREPPPAPRAYSAAGVGARASS